MKFHYAAFTNACLRVARVAARQMFPAVPLPPARRKGGAGGFCIMGLTLFAHLLPAQIPAPQWDRTYGGAQKEFLTALLPAGNGNYLLAGTSSSGIGGEKTQPGKGASDYWLVWTDANGNKVRDRAYGTDSSDRLSAIVPAHGGGFLLAGTSTSGIGGDKSEPSRGGSDYWVVRIDAGGNKQWNHTYGGNGDDDLKAIVATADGGYLLGGSSESGVSGEKRQPGKGESDYWIVKINGTGHTLWTKTYGGRGADALSAIVPAPDGGYLLGGSSSSGLGGDKTGTRRGEDDFWLVKIDSNGNKQWDKTLGGKGSESLFALLPTTDGGYLAGGTSSSGISGDVTDDNRGSVISADFWVAKIDGNGRKQWTRRFGGNEQDYLRSMIRTADGDYLLGGSSLSDKSGEVSEKNRTELSGKGGTGADYWIVKIGGRTGHKLWDKRFGGRTDEKGSYDDLYAVLQTPGGDYLLAGHSETAKGFEKSEDSRGKTDYWIVKATPETAAVNSFTLVNTDTEEDIGEIKDGDVINLGALRTTQLNIRANTGPTRVGSVLFNLRGSQTRNHVEDGAPYALFGDDDQDYFPWTPELATGNYDYTLTATPYSTSAGRGEKGTPRTIHFRVIFQVVNRFTLVNADTDEDIGEIKEGDVININALPTTHLNVRASTDPATVGSVLFALRGPQTRNHVENSAPYALFGNNGQDYLPWTPEPVSGDYTLTATPYSAAASGGEKGRAYSVAFKLIECTPDVVNLILRHEAAIPEGNAALREGEAIDIVIKLRNTGEGAANAVQVQIDSLTGCSANDPEITFDEITTSEGTYNNGIWKISLLNGCSEAKLVIAGVKRSNVGVINSAARVKDGSAASSIRIDVVEEGEENLPGAKFQIDIGAPDEMVEETPAPVDINVTNGGPRTAKNVRLTYAVTAIVEGKDPDTLSSVRQSFGDLSPGCQIPTIKFNVALSRPGTIRIHVTVFSDNAVGFETKEITVTVTPGDPDSTPEPNGGSSAARRANEMNDASAGPRLYPGYPNPFRAATTIPFRLAKESRVQLAVLDKHGLPVNHLLNQVMPAGKHKARWQPGNLPSGVYVVQLRVDDAVKSQRIVLIR